jgi:3'-phosphoadenosine 5'-phosphosulfate sulfotransferase (PAPS reductase)/FAD synthetase
MAAPDEVKARLAGRRVIASISGGKDSAAMSLYLHELGIEHDRVFMDTSWELPPTYEYLRGELASKIGPITWLRPALPALDAASIRRPLVRAAVEAGNAMVILCLTKGMFPSRVIRFCTEALKVVPMQVHLNALVASGEDVVNAVGIRAAESEARSRMTEWEWSRGFDCEVWRPLLRWSEQDVIDIHQRRGLRPNPLYLRGASRVGCGPCIYARKSEIRFLADEYSERIELLIELEAELTERARARALERGEELRSERTWFQQGSGRAIDQLWPIRKTVAWSRTLRGGRAEDRQVELFARADEGCMRWGLCEGAAADGGDRAAPAPVTP